MKPICVSIPAAIALQPPSSQWLAGVSVETPLATSIPTIPPSGRAMVKIATAPTRTCWSSSGWGDGGDWR